MLPEPLPKLAKAKKYKIWQRARKHLLVLLIRQDHKCHWCQRELYTHSTIPAGWTVVPKVKKKKKGNNTFQLQNAQGVVRYVLKATVDHVSPISQTDPAIVNNLDNLVASCQTCNHNRSKTPKKPDKICKGCTSIVANIGFCNNCRIENFVYWELMKVTRT